VIFCAAFCSFRNSCTWSVGSVPILSAPVTVSPRLVAIDESPPKLEDAWADTAPCRARLASMISNERATLPSESALETHRRKF
jgi:hypothetical protein